MHALSDSSPLPLYAQIAELLRGRILRGDWKEGDRLPSHEALTREFDVARVTVRQAIMLLEGDGLLTSRRGRGTFVWAGGCRCRPRSARWSRCCAATSRNCSTSARARRGRS
jgi:GntR family transcriptional regulator